MTKKPAPKTKAVAHRKTSRPRVETAIDNKSVKQTEPAPLPVAAPPVTESIAESSDEPPNAPRPLTPEQKNMDLLTQIELALGIKETALFGKKGLISAHNFQISPKDCQTLLDWLEHRLDASIKARQESGEEAPEVEIGNLRTHFDRPPQEFTGGAVPIYGNDMYTLVFYPRGTLWLMAAYNYELDVPYLDFQTWQKDLLVLVDEFGL